MVKCQGFSRQTTCMELFAVIPVTWQRERKGGSQCYPAVLQVLLLCICSMGLLWHCDLVTQGQGKGGTKGGKTADLKSGLWRNGESWASLVTKNWLKKLNLGRAPGWHCCIQHSFVLDVSGSKSLLTRIFCLFCKDG